MCILFFDTTIGSSLAGAGCAFLGDIWCMRACVWACMHMLSVHFAPNIVVGNLSFISRCFMLSCMARAVNRGDLILSFCVNDIPLQIATLTTYYRQLAQREKLDKEKKKYSRRKSYMVLTVSAVTTSSVNWEMLLMFSCWLEDMCVWMCVCMCIRVDL
jgi:hypothetical protein